MSKNISVNFPFFSILTLIFITLKLIGYISWSWWWVLSPLWLPYVVIFGAIGIGVAFAGIVLLIGGWIDKLKQ